MGAMKKKHTTIRLDTDTAAIVESYQKVWGTQISETVSRLILAADGKESVIVVSTAVAKTNDLSYFAGRLDKVILLWREIKSRLNAPRPIDPDDYDAMNKWQEDREKIKMFYDDCRKLWQQSHALAADLSGISLSKFRQMEEAAIILKSWSDDYKEYAAEAINIEKKNGYLLVKRDLDTILAVLLRLGVKTNIQ
jgi:hypothetical protein